MVFTFSISANACRICNLTLKWQRLERCFFKNSGLSTSVSNFIPGEVDHGDGGVFFQGVREGLATPKKAPLPTKQKTAAASTSASPNLPHQKLSLVGWLFFFSRSARPSSGVMQPIGHCKKQREICGQDFFQWVFYCEGPESCYELPLRVRLSFANLRYRSAYGCA